MRGGPGVANGCIAAVAIGPVFILALLLPPLPAPRQYDDDDEEDEWEGTATLAAPPAALLGVLRTAPMPCVPMADGALALPLRSVVTWPQLLFPDGRVAPSGGVPCG